MEIAIAEVYARGLYGAAMDSRSTDEVRDELHQMESIVKENKMFCRFLQDPAISKVIKKQKINAIFKGRVTDVTLHFLCLLVDKGRVALFHQIAAEYDAIDDHEKNVGEGVIESAVPLSDEDIERFNREVSAFYNKKIRLHNKVNKSLIGGVRIYAEDQMFDASLKSRLDQLHERIQNGSV
jgi:F-type H+-transporting ATPase subunit delta